MVVMPFGALNELGPIHSRRDLPLDGQARVHPSPIAGPGVLTITAMLNRAPAHQEFRQRIHAWGAVGYLAGPASPMTAAPLLEAFGEVPAPPLPPQLLVDLLKHPCCVGASRRAVLDQLERHYGKHFADHWDFVRYATEERLDLDLTAPPVRAALPIAVEKKKAR